MKFQPGMIVSTPNALDSIASDEIAIGLKRHLQGDWGDLDAEDKARNNLALVEGTRLLSAYHDSKGTKFWIITEADRSVTTVLLPEDY